MSHRYDLLQVWPPHRRSSTASIFAARHAQALDLIRHASPAPARVLDIAAAQGNFTLPLAEAGYEVTWNDLREDLAGYVRLKHESGIVHYAPGDVFRLSLAHPFDIVLIAEVIEHVAHPDAFLRTITEYVRPGGFVVMTTPNGRFWRNTLPRFSDCEDPSVFESSQFKPDADGHIFLLHPDEIGPLAQQAGLELRELRLFTNPLTAGFSGTGLLLRVLPTAIVDVIEGLSRRLPQPVTERLMTGMAVLLQRPA